MKPRIIPVGPTRPYRGGIAHYNSALLMALRAGGLGDTGYSFSRQYPAWLYPGKSDLDPSSGAAREEGVDYAIDSIAPLSWIRAIRRIANQKPDLVVFHWWTIFWLPCFWTMMRRLRRKGIPSALICHNLVDHDAGALKSWLSDRLLREADAFLVHSEEHARHLVARFPGKPIARHPLPVYDHYPTVVERLPKRGRLELLFFGFIRPYKGLDLLVEALAHLQDENIHLTVVGEPWGDVAEITRLAERAPNIELHLDYVPDEAAGKYFDRADLVVLPYRAATGSAVASLALGYGKPLLVTRVGALPEVVTHGINGYVVPPGDATALAQTIAATDRQALEAMTDGVQASRRAMSWESLASTLAQMADALQSSTAGSSRGGA